MATGDGYVREFNYPLASLINTGGTAYALSNNLGVLLLQDDNDSVHFQFQVPLDYDASQDELAVTLTTHLSTGDLSVGTNKITLNFGTVRYIRPGDAPVAGGTDLDSLVTSQPQTPDDLLITQQVFDLSHLGLKPGDCMSVEISATEDGTAEAVVFGATVRYRSGLAANDIAQRESIERPIDNA